MNGCKVSGEGRGSRRGLYSTERREGVRFVKYQEKGGGEGSIVLGEGKALYSTRRREEGCIVQGEGKRVV